ncbi:hypothetical protein ACTOV4_23530 [Brucella sp. C7-11G]
MQVSASLLAAVKNWKPPAFPDTAYLPQKRPTQRVEQTRATIRPQKIKLSSTARLLLNHIERICRKGELETTKASLGGWLMRCRRAVRYALQELEDAGLIRTETTIGPLGLYSGLKIWIASAFNAAEFYAKATKVPESGGAKPCITSPETYLLTLQRRALSKIREKSAAAARLDQLRLQIE